MITANTMTTMTKQAPQQVMVPTQDGYRQITVTAEDITRAQAQGRLTGHSLRESLHSLRSDDKR